MHLAVVCYPELVEGAREWIEDLRSQYAGLQHDPLPPNMNLVYPVANLDSTKLIEHVQHVVESFAPFRFVVRCAIPVKDTLSPSTYVILPPDEGFSSVVFLRDALYTGILGDHLSDDAPFIPHVAVGYTDDIDYARRIVDDINGVEFEMEGEVRTLDILHIGDDGIKTISRIDL